MKKLLVFVWNTPIFLQKVIMVVGGCVVGILIFVEVFLRYVLGSPLFGVEELILFIAIWLYFIGAAYGAYERTHIKAELIHLWFTSSRSRAVIRSITGVITVFLALTMLKWSYPYFIWGLTRGATSQALLLPMVLCQSAIFFGAILMCIYFTAELIDNILLSLGKKQVFAPLSEKDS
ncbi:MAG: TRAP transporter small permease [Desulfohalobiaceae bacterium]|nr:TRAP transporter small permease [Desulfohalobiaceae bacterium]